MKFDPKDPKNWIKTSDKYGYYHIPPKEVFGYAIIDFAANLVFLSVSLFITYYFTDIVGLRPAHVAILFLLSKVWDAINDPIMGTIVERLSPKKGKYWPYIMWGAVPFGIAAMLTYAVPTSFSYGARMVWAILAFNFVNMMFTFIVQPYLAAITLMTNDQDERVRVQSWHMTGSQCGGVACSIILPMLSNYLTKYMSLAQGYMISAGLMGIIMIVCLLWGSRQIVERIPPQPVTEENKASIKDVFHFLGMGPVFLMFILFLGVYSMSQIQATMGTYYVKYYAGREDLISWFSLAMMICSVFGVPVVPFLTRYLKKKGTVIFGLVVSIIGCGILYLMPPTALAGMMISRCITGFGYGVLMGIIWSIVSDPVDYIDLKTGKRYPTIVSTITQGFGVKGACIIGSSVTSALLDMSGYVANQPQTESTVQFIRQLTSLYAMGAALVALILFGLFYHIDEKKIVEMQHAIALRDGVISQ